MLSKRLEAVAALVPQGTVVADIGCDHAYLPLALLTRSQVQRAIGCDINEGPLSAARKNAAHAGITADQLELRLGNGLEALMPGEVSVVTLAGMGAGLMVDILSATPEVVAELERIVVSPNVAPWLLRRWAMEHGFSVSEESVVRDNAHYYEVFALEPTQESIYYTDFQIYFGLDLPHHCNNVTTDYFAERRKHDARLLATWASVRERHADAAVRYDRLSALWKEWEEKRPCV